MVSRPDRDAYGEMAEIDQLIQEKLDGIERDLGVRIVHACESGSRAWGFASPDSDYDVRFLFVRPERDYLSVVPGLESIDLPLDGDLDFGGWDVRKAAGLLGKSNAALVEWLHSPIVYRAAPGFLGRWRSAVEEVFSPRASADHYRGLAKQMMRGKLADGKVRAKDYLYALRAVLAARWVLGGGGCPPVPFADLLPLASDELRALVPGLLEHKAATGEGELMARMPVVDEFLECSLAEIESGTAAIPQGRGGVEVVSRLLRREIRDEGAAMVASDFTLSRVREPDLLLFDTVAGSQAYGTAIAGSDEDRRGVFVAPPSFLLGLEAIEQVSDKRHDETYYEIGRFVEMLLKNNPNALELLAMPEDCVRHRDPLFERLTPELFLSKRCARTFGEYAMGQIRKARGLNKKIVNPQPEQRRPMLSFCQVPSGQGSVPVLEWLEMRGIKAEDCGLTAVAHAAGLCAIYHDPSVTYRGLVSTRDPDALVFSSVAKEAEPVAWLHFNQDAFKAHCKAHREYWDWVELRNEERYSTNAGHGRGYDSKNLLHTLRLLDMAEEIAREGVIRVRRPNREFLLQVREGSFGYEELVARAEAQLARVKQAFLDSGLQDEPDRVRVNEVLVAIREEFRMR